jgi:integrase
MKLRLTDMAIKKLQHPLKGQVTYWDQLMPGFGLRCSSKSKAFVVMYGEKRQLKTLGRYPGLSLSDARMEAKRFFVQQDEGIFAGTARSISFEAAKKLFLSDSEGRNKPRTAADYNRLLNKHFNFADDLEAVTRQQIMTVISRLAKTPSEQSHAYVAIRTMLNWCIRHGLIEHSPVPVIKHGTTPRNRVLNDDELRQIILRAEETPDPFGPIVKTLILTGQRRSEVGQLRQSWLFDDLIVFPEGFTKNKREHQFPVTPMVKQVLDTVSGTTDLLFPAATNPDKPFSGWAWHKSKFDEGFENVTPYTLHDLRRTFATVHARIGTPIHVTERLLNHVTGAVSGVAAVYNRHSYLPEMFAAQRQYEAFIQDLMRSDQASKVGQNVLS